MRALLCVSTVWLCVVPHTTSCITPEVDGSSAMGKVSDTSGLNESESGQALVWSDLISCAWYMRDPLACAGFLR